MQFEWNPDLNLNHSSDSIRAMQYMADFFITEARKNSQSFSTQSELDLARNLSTYGMTSKPMSSDILTGYFALVFSL